MSKYDRLDSLFEGFENRIAIGDLEDKVKASVIKDITKDIALDAPSTKLLNDEMGTVYFNLDTLEVESDGSAETIADLLDMTPEEFAKAISEILKKIPAKDLGKYEAKVEENRTTFLYGMKMFESFAPEIVSESVIPQELKKVLGVKSVSEDKYDDMLGVLPPIYISSVDDIPVSGFAVSEPYDDDEHGNPTFGIYFEFQKKYYHAIASLTKPDDKPITYAMYNNEEYSRGNKAKSVKNK